MKVVNQLNISKTFQKADPLSKIIKLIKDIFVNL